VVLIENFNVFRWENHQKSVMSSVECRPDALRVSANTAVWVEKSAVQSIYSRARSHRPLQLAIGQQHINSLLALWLV